MDVNVRRELQGYVSEFVGGGDEDAVRELVKIVSKSEGPYECIAIFDSVLYKLRTKRVREKLRAIKLLSTLSSASQRFALVVAEGVQSITKWTVLEAGVSQEVRKETEEFLTEWYVLYSSSPAVRRASRHLAVRAGIPLQTRIHDEREDVVSIDGIVEQIREIVAEMESCFDILVPRFAEVSEGTEGIHLVDFSAYKALDAEGVPRDDDQDVVDGTENLDESGEEVDIEIDIGATAGRSEDMQPIISNLQDRLRALTRKETVLSSVREESTTEKKRLVDATIAKVSSLAYLLRLSLDRSSPAYDLQFVLRSHPPRFSL